MDPIVNNQVPPVTPTPSVPTPPAFQVDSLMKNQKLVETVKTFAIYGTVLAVARTLINYLASSVFFHVGGYSLNIAGVLVSTVISGLIFSAIGGVIFYFVFDWIKGFIKGSAFLSKYINNLFTFFWIPTLVGSVVVFILAALPLLSLLSLGIIILVSVAISLVTNLALYYFYAKTVSAKLQSYYPW